MQLGPLKRYETQLKKWIYNYAYENYNSPPLIEKADCDWHGEVFDVADIDINLHYDVWQDLKTKDILKYIRAYCDKFVILPDVFSQRPIPLTTQRNEFDMDRQNIVILNNKIWELEHKKIKREYIYNHNRHTYIFFDSATGSDLYITPEGTTPSMEVITVYTNCFIIEDVKTTEKWWEMTDDWFGLELTADDKIAVDHSQAVSGIYINAPYMEFDYEKNIPTEQEPIIHGLMSQSKDQWIRPKWFNMLENQSFIHNEKLLFTNTALIIFKDNNYIIENLYINPIGKYVEKIDKHTIKVNHDPDNQVKKIIFFLRPYNQVEWVKPDSLYYTATEENEYSAVYLKSHKKYTNSLLDYLDWNMNASIEEMIEWGYKYDLDILTTIQNFFSRLIILNKFDMKLVEYYEGEKFYKPKFCVTIQNKLQAYPALFINHRLYMADYRIIKNDDNDTLIIDPEQFFRLIDYTPTEYIQPKTVRATPRGVPEPPYVPPQTIIDKYQDIPWLEANLKLAFDDIRIVFTSQRPLNVEQVSNQGGRIFRTPYRTDLVADWFGDNPIMIGGYPFTNGYLTTDYITDKIFRRYDNVNIFGFGDLNFKVTLSPTSGRDVYDDKGHHTVFEDTDDMTLLINRTTKKLDGICRLYFNDAVTSHVVDYYTHDIPEFTDKAYKVKQTVIFDKYGLECTDTCRILSNKYINFDYSYNYVNDEKYGVNPNMVFNIFDLKLTDYRRDYDLEIDPDKIDKAFNIGAYNENCMLDPHVRALFNPNEPSLTKPIPVELKTPKRLVGEKILTRYFLGIRHVITDTARFTQEIAGLNNNYVKPDGSIGVIPDDCKDFAKDTSFNGHPLATRMIGEAAASDALSKAGVTYIQYKGVVINSDDRYTVELSSEEDAHITVNKNALPLRVNSDIDMNRCIK